jgi:hypothetical protein
MCDGMETADAQRLSLQLYILGYSTSGGGDWLSEDAFYALPRKQIFTEESRWTDMLNDLQTTADIPDFSTQAVFVEVAGGGGCGVPSVARAWAWNDRVRVDIRDGDDGRCDAGFPQLNVAIVDVSDAEGLGWCE